MPIYQHALGTTYCHWNWHNSAISGYNDVAGLAEPSSTRSQLRAGLARCMAAVPPDVLDAHVIGAKPSATVSSPDNRRKLSTGNCTRPLEHNRAAWPASCVMMLVGCRDMAAGLSPGFTQDIRIGADTAFVQGVPIFAAPTACRI